MGSSLGKKNGSERPGKSAPQMKFGLPDFGQVIACVSLHKLLRLVALQALDGGPFQSFQHKGAEVIPNTNGEEKHYLVCVGRQILPMHRNQLQLVAVPKVDTWICTNKNGWGGRPVWGWEFPSFPNQIHQALKAVILLQQLN